MTITAITSRSHHPQIFERDAPTPATSRCCEQPTVEVNNAIEDVFEGILKGEGGCFMTHWR